MKTRLRTNKERTSYQLDVIKNGNLEQYYFSSLEKAIEYQKSILFHVEHLLNN
jgi:hypothetical protein